MRYLSLPIFLLGLMFVFSACSTPSAEPEHVAQVPTANDVIQLVKNSNQCSPDDLACKPLDQLKEALQAAPDFGLADFNAFMQTATNSVVKVALINSFQSKMNESSLALLKNEMSNLDWRLRRAAQDAVASIGGDQAIEILVDLLLHQKDDVRETIPILLAKTPKHTKVKAVLPTLRKMGEKATNNAARANAINAVAKIEGHQAVRWLIKIALRNDSIPARKAAVEALAPWADETPVYNCLVDVSKDKENATLARLAKKIAIEANKR